MITEGGKAVYDNQKRLVFADGYSTKKAREIKLGVVILLEEREEKIVAYDMNKEKRK